MAALEAKNCSSPDETRRLADKGTVEVVQLGGVTIGRVTLQPGWRWSEHVKPIVGTASCQAPHTGYVIAGRLHVRMDDGTERELGPGDAFFLPPGHDAWVVGNEAHVNIDFTGMADYARPS
jgi:quercetin dioxygenase-like cupin family protein